MKFTYGLLVVLAVLTLGTTTLATTATAGDADGVWAPRSWDGGGGIVYYGDPDGGGGGGIEGRGSTGSEATTYGAAKAPSNSDQLYRKWMLVIEVYLQGLMRRGIAQW